jgi:peroxin-16
MSLPPTPPLSAMDETEDHPKNNGHPKSNGHPTEHSVQPRSTKQQSSISKTISVLSLPKEWLTQYSHFVQKNASSVSQIESALRSLTYIIPGRFRDAEIASESLHSAVQLLSIYHDSLLLRAVSKLPGMPKLERPLNRYTKYWITKSASYRRIALLLQCIRYTELLWEMAAKRKGEKVRWRVVVIIEALKALCRLLLLRITGGRMVVPPLPEREPLPTDSDSDSIDPESTGGLTSSELEEIDSAYGSGSDHASPTLHPSSSSPKGWNSGKWPMPRTGLSLPQLPSAHEISSYLISKVLTAEDIRPAPFLISKIASSSAALAEILHIMRPVVYAVAMQRAYASSRDPAKGVAAAKRNWNPWLLGIALELLARQLRSASLTREGGGFLGRSSLKETTLEKEEWSRRGWAMGWWAFRGAFYENVTKQVVDRVVESRWVPGLVGGIVSDYAFLWEEYHFASSDM